ncbi:MAG: hypothetical protein H0X28_05850 [Solirubrobacterales bacterium]|nr:hypothetical protein [Solirubrobacterales bacterium]
MLSAIFVSLIIIFALGFSLRSSRDGVTITRRPYNNRYSDAAGAREDHVG